MKCLKWTLILVAATIFRAFSADGIASGVSLGANNDTLTGRWQGSFTPTSKLGILRARVDLARETAVAGANLSGVWKGDFDKIGPSGRVTHAPFYLNLEQDGTKLLGTAGPTRQEQAAIAGGTTGGEKILFEAPHHPSGPNIKFDLRLINDRLQGTARMEDKEEKVPSRPLRATLTQRGEEISGEISLERDHGLLIKGKREQNRIIMSTVSEDLAITFELRFVNERLQGEASLEHDGHLIKAKVELSVTPQ